MMLSPQPDRSGPRDILFAPTCIRDRADWWEPVSDAFRPTGLSPVMADTTAEAIACVERGGLAAAVLIRDRARSDGLALLQIIRSIDVELPCWLLMDDPSRAMLETAFALRATCVMRNPPTPAGLALAVRRFLSVRG